MEKEYENEPKEENKKIEKKKRGFEKIQNAFAKSFVPPENKGSSKWRDLQIRSLWTFIMVFLFFLILSMGHFYCAFLVFFIIICINSELINLSKYKERNSEIKGYSFISWYIFLTGVYYFYIRAIKSKISYLNSYQIIHYFLRYHNFICFMLYILGFFLFLQSLQKNFYKYQFRHFAYVHIILLLFGCSSGLIISNIFNGMIWFILPASMVIINDISAYIWGRMFGKHQLSLLSPKKTWEGFIGGFFTTILWGFLFTNYLLKFESLLCPVTEIGIIPFKQFNMKCENIDLKKVEYTYLLFGKFNIEILNIHIHAFSMSLFAGIFAPLGGLFASGFKRGIGIKDFADTIPGHGGLTDRMDCQLLMGIFTYVWIRQFVFFDEKKAFDSLLKKIDLLNYNDKIALYKFIGKSLGF